MTIIRLYDTKRVICHPTRSQEQGSVQDSGYTCCYQALCPNRYILEKKFFSQIIDVLLGSC